MFVRSSSEIEDGVKTIVKYSLEKFSINELNIITTLNEEDSSIVKLKTIVSMRHDDNLKIKNAIIASLKSAFKSHKSIDFNVITKDDILIITIEFSDKVDKIYKFCNEQILKLINNAWKI